MFNNTWSPENEAGIVNLGVAENALMVRTISTHAGLADKLSWKSFERYRRTNWSNSTVKTCKETLIEWACLTEIISLLAKERVWHWQSS
jgi:hypothetical protein